MVLACNTRQLDELIELYAADALVLRSNLPRFARNGGTRVLLLRAGSRPRRSRVEPIRVEVVGDLAHEVGRYSALVPAQPANAAKSAANISGLREAERRRLEAGLGMLVERLDSDHCGIRDPEARPASKAAAAKRLVAWSGCHSEQAFSAQRGIWRAARCGALLATQYLRVWLASLCLLPHSNLPQLCAQLFQRLHLNRPHAHFRRALQVQRPIVDEAALFWLDLCSLKRQTIDATLRLAQAYKARTDKQTEDSRKPYFSMRNKFSSRIHC